MNEMQQFEIEVFNANGELQAVRYSDVPDLSELPSGEYTIRFQQGNDTYTERFIKK
jgi:hypothetical protein